MCGREGQVASVYLVNDGSSSVVQQSQQLTLIDLVGLD